MGSETPPAPPPTGETGPPGRVYDEIMYVYGGYRNSTMLDDMWKYDPAANTWEEVDIGGGVSVFLPVAARSGHTVTPMADGSALILGGIDTNVNFLKDLWKRNPDNTYEQLADPPYPFITTAPI